MEVDKEIWKPIPFCNDYDVSNFGRVRSWKYGTPRVLSPGKDSGGYLRCLLYTKGKSRGFLLHRLVLLSFVGQPKPGQEASHLDGDKTNNALSNLAWETPTENNLRKIQHGTYARGEQHFRSKLSSKDITDIRLKRRQGLTYPEIAKQYPVHVGHIKNICIGRRWGHVI